MNMLRQPVEGPSVWTGADLERDRSWTYALSHEQVADLDRALCSLRDGRGFAAVPEASV